MLWYSMGATQSTNRARSLMRWPVKDFVKRFTSGTT